MESVMVRDGRGVSIRLVLLLGLVVTAIAYPGLRVWTGQGHELPPASWGAVIVLVFMACARTSVRMARSGLSGFLACPRRKRRIGSPVKKTPQAMNTRTMTAPQDAGGSS